jgi:protein-tyrosine phosphatase
MSCQLDATKIAPKIYQGSMPPPGTHVRACGFDVLVLMAETHEYTDEGGYVPGNVSFPGVKVIHAPIDDGVLSESEWTEAIAAATQTARYVRKGARVLITCRMGRNRSGLVTALTLHMLTRKSGGQIVKHVQMMRSGALTNRSFVRALEGLR